ncbi:MAG TPA: hypothetical protein VN922_02370 [Bacteroidia bacterium]|nr:hypothetical protein [Bacteroidia bacterium]
MKRFLNIALVTAAIMPLIANAQYASDALRYSQLTFGGTARYMAMGGAFSAVGGDMSTLAVNPAGIAVFNKSQLAFSPGFSFQSTTSTYNGESNIAQQSAGSIQNAGLILAWRNKSEDAMWKGINFGIVYNRTNNFNAQVYTEGHNNTSTMLDQYTDEANGTNYADLDQFYTGPVFNSGLLDTNNGGNTYFNIIRPFLNNGNYILQQKSLSTSGHMGETDISFGGNYNNKLYIGATLGIPDISYNEITTYSETPKYNDTVFGLTGYSIQSNVTTTGSGVNLKLGFIYRPNDWIRVGLAVHTPTAFSLTDQYSTVVTAIYNPGPYAGTTPTNAPLNSPQGSFNYTLITPMRAIGGLAFVIHRQAILSADYEYVDYSTASFNAPGTSYSAVNQTIANSYMGASNIRVGGELLLYPFSIRAGYAYYGNPYTKDAANTNLKRSISGGVGVRINHCFIDLAYVMSYYDHQDYMYESAYAPYGTTTASNHTTLSDVVLTMGVNF